MVPTPENSVQLSKLRVSQHDGGLAVAVPLRGADQGGAAAWSVGLRRDRPTTCGAAVAVAVPSLMEALPGLWLVLKHTLQKPVKTAAPMLRIVSVTVDVPDVIDLVALEKSMDVLADPDQAILVSAGDPQ